MNFATSVQTLILRWSRWWAIVAIVSEMLLTPRRAFCSEADSIAKALERITISDLKRHCVTLASDALEGREAGSNGGKAASAYLQTELRKVSGIEGAGKGGWTQEFAPDYRNVLAVLPGSDPELRRETIVIGAHYDHVGRGNQTNSYGPFGYIHNGADDNASGTAALLELAEAFASLTPAPKRTLMFAFWDAEEVGLLGSKHWVAYPTRPLKDIRLVLNIDMLGRLREGKVVVMGWRSAPGLRARLAAVNLAGDLNYQFTPRVIADSDHYPFYEAGIPSLHFDSGKHDDYHRPTDDADKLNYEGIRRLAEMVFRLAYAATDEATLPNFRRDALTEAPPTWLTPRPTAQAPLRLGVAFNSQQAEQNIAIISQVTPGSPAARAGIRPGDRIGKMAHWEGGRVDDLRTIIQTAKSPLAIRLQRQNAPELIDLSVELLGDPVRLGIAWQTDPAMPDTIAITHIVPDSPADRAGLKAADVVMSLDAQAIISDESFRRRVLTEPGPLQLRIEREGRLIDVLVNLFEPESAGQ